MSAPAATREASRLVALAAVVAVSALAVAGCSRALEVTLPAYANDPACQRAAARWPTTVSKLEARPVSVDSPAARAWGDPPIVALCGTEPIGPTDRPCVGVDGVDWVLLPASDGTRFTTYGRSPAIDVFVPSRYAPEGMVLPSFAAAALTLPENGHHCT